jgi:hypothetical protein
MINLLVSTVMAILRNFCNIYFNVIAKEAESCRYRTTRYALGMRCISTIDLAAAPPTMAIVVDEFSELMA